ncbi:hypothetical protein CVT25_014373 [Psilocybe cyanescens]|uniref:Uncharacterized protein n=1 Tax=Psilocybe cyanescens TaxID=93625 RepID=A0A409XPN5_PSICY|nr:hypothetical protein CVT25_014373 [Psilocybe cyanescens]
MIEKTRAIRQREKDTKKRRKKEEGKKREKVTHSSIVGPDRFLFTCPNPSLPFPSFKRQPSLPTLITFITSPITPPAPALHPTPSSATLDFVFTNAFPPISRSTWLRST